METLLPGENRRGFNYGEDEHDRMKNIFMQNGSHGFCHTFNYDALIHPSEHAGKNRFHLISPLNNDEVCEMSVQAPVAGTFINITMPQCIQI